MNSNQKSYQKQHSSPGKTSHYNNNEDFPIKKGAYNNQFGLSYDNISPLKMHGDYAPLSNFDMQRRCALLENEIKV